MVHLKSFGKFRKIVFFVVFLLCLVVNAEAATFYAYPSSNVYITFVRELPKQIDKGPLKGFKLGWKHKRYTIYGLPLGGSTEGSYVVYKWRRRGWYVQNLEPKHLIQFEIITEEELTHTSRGSVLSLIWGWLVFAPLFVIRILFKLAVVNRMRQFRSNAPNTKVRSGRQAFDEKIEQARIQRIDARIETLKKEKQSKRAEAQQPTTGMHYNSVKPQFGRR